jgi:hypothetical protein
MLVVVKCVVYLCKCAYFFIVIDVRFEQHPVFCGGEIFEYQGDDQGQAEQGKPSKLVAYLILVLLIA